ncbi:putative ATP synthase, F0 complex, subunit D [Helianthus anomalus]
MSHPGKKVVDVAFKASKSIDWDGMAKMIVSDEARKEFSSFRRAFEEVNSTLKTKFSQVYLYVSESMDMFVYILNLLFY